MSIEITKPEYHISVTDDGTGKYGATASKAEVQYERETAACNTCAKPIHCDRLKPSLLDTLTEQYYYTPLLSPLGSVLQGVQNALRQHREEERLKFAPWHHDETGSVYCNARTTFAMVPPDAACFHCGRQLALFVSDDQDMHWVHKETGQSACDPRQAQPVNIGV